jgi:DNA-binding LytR/AlgR family response regulator
MSKKKNRLIVRKRDEHVALGVDEIAFIYRNEMLVVVVDKQEKKYLCDKTLTDLEAELDESHFFRANRQYIVNIDFIRSFKVFEKVKLEVFLKIPQAEHQIIVSQKTAPLFKKWVSGE